MPGDQEIIDAGLAGVEKLNEICPGERIFFFFHAVGNLTRQNGGTERKEVLWGIEPSLGEIAVLHIRLSPRALGKSGTDKVCDNLGC